MCVCVCVCVCVEDVGFRKSYKRRWCRITRDEEWWWWQVNLLSCESSKTGWCNNNNEK